MLISNSYLFAILAMICKWSVYLKKDRWPPQGGISLQKEREFRYFQLDFLEI